MNRALSAKVTACTAGVKRRGLLLIFAAVYLYAFPYFGLLRHANELPRILTTVQLAERGTFHLDERMADLGSRADIAATPAGHYFQNKTPGLSILALPIYYPFSLAFRAAGRSTTPLMFTTWLLRVGAVTVPCALFLAVFARTARRFATSVEARNAALVAYALGSMALPYGMLFMPHALAAALVGTGFALATKIARREARDADKAAIAVGALLGLATFIEYQAILGSVIVGAYAVLRAERPRRIAVMVAVAAAPFFAGLAIYHTVTFGSPVRTGYAYAVDPANHVGFMGIVGPSQASVSQLLWRVDNGLLPLSPWVLLSIVGAVAIARDPAARIRVGAEAVVAVLVVLVYCAFVAALEPEFGRAGWCVGPRYLAVSIPFFAWLAAAGLDACLTQTALRAPAYALVLVGVGVHVLAATTYPHWPTQFENPLFEVSLRSLREGHAPHSLGTLVGLRGLASLAPLYVGIAALVVRLLAPARRHLLELVLAGLLALFVVSRYESLARTPRSVEAADTWAFVQRTLEP